MTNRCTPAFTATKFAATTRFILNSPPRFAKQHPMQNGSDRFGAQVPKDKPEICLNSHSSSVKKTIDRSVATRSLKTMNNSQSSNVVRAFPSVSLVNQFGTFWGSKQTVSFVDLFCGIGGFHSAGSQLGLKCVFACDIDADCRKIYK